MTNVSTLGSTSKTHKYYQLKVTPVTGTPTTGSAECGKGEVFSLYRDTTYSSEIQKNPTKTNTHYLSPYTAKINGA